MNRKVFVILGLSGWSLIACNELSSVGNALGLTQEEESNQVPLAAALLLLSDSSRQAETDLTPFAGTWTMNSMSCNGTNNPMNTYTSISTISAGNGTATAVENNARTLCGNTATFANCTTVYSLSRSDSTLTGKITSISPNQNDCPGNTVGLTVTSTVTISGSTITQTTVQSGTTIVFTYTKS